MFYVSKIVLFWKSSELGALNPRTKVSKASLERITTCAAVQALCILDEEAIDVANSQLARAILDSRMDAIGGSVLTRADESIQGAGGLPVTIHKLGVRMEIPECLQLCRVEICPRLRRRSTRAVTRVVASGSQPSSSLAPHAPVLDDQMTFAVKVMRKVTNGHMESARNEIHASLLRVLYSQAASKRSGQCSQK